MDISVGTKDNFKIIGITGRLDSITSSKLEGWVDEFLSSIEGNIIMDFSQLEYISSAGLRVILNISKKMKPHPYNFSICNAQDHVREVFEISGFDSIIPLYKSIDECMGSGEGGTGS